jgi:hypothetical protein
MPAIKINTKQIKTKAMTTEKTAKRTSSDKTNDVIAMRKSWQYLRRNLFHIRH